MTHTYRPQAGPKETHEVVVKDEKGITVHRETGHATPAAAKTAAEDVILKRTAAASKYRDALERYYKASAKAPRATGSTVPAEPDPMTDSEHAALSELAEAIEDLNLARKAWQDAGRPPL